MPKIPEGLRESEVRFNRYKIAFESPFTASIVMGPDGIIRQVNATTSRMFGYSAEELVGEKVTKLMPEKYRVMHTQSLERYLKTGQASVIGKHVVQLEGLRKDGEVFPLELEVHDATFELGVEFVAEIRDITEKVEAERELRHRMSNQAANMRAIVRMGLKSSHSLEDAESRIESQLRAFSSVHNILEEHQSISMPLRELLDALTRPYAQPERSERINMAGGDVNLSPKMADLGLAINELATNATKYGALSTPEGFVKISWEVSFASSTPLLRLLWQEWCGFKVKKPDHKGFGIRFIERTVKNLHGEVSFNFPREGLHCLIEIPLAP